MNTKKIISTITSIAATAAITLSSSAFAWSPCLSATSLSSKSVSEGGSIAFELKYTNDIARITLDASDVGLRGFTGDVLIITSGNNRIVVVTNIHDGVGENRIVVPEGTAISSDGRKANSIFTESFTIVR